MCVKLTALRKRVSFIIIYNNLQKTVPVLFKAAVPRAVDMAPVNPAGCDRQDVLRSARAFMKEVKSVGAVLPSVRFSNQDSNPVHVSGSVRPRNSTLVEVPVRPRGAGLGCLPVRSVQQGGTARG